MEVVGYSLAGTIATVPLISWGVRPIEAQEGIDELMARSYTWTIRRRNMGRAGLGVVAGTVSLPAGLLLASP